MNNPQGGGINKSLETIQTLVFARLCILEGVIIFTSLSPYQLSKDTYLNDPGNKVEQ